ncbi:hypothetical protein F5141DRAFT_1067711 [Pisolithus sp. B1]|nr:hypothetical protein F5141DRAFT_1067711 [Pisolithus sp. B1]
MVTPIHITPATLNDVAFAVLEQYTRGIPFDQELWLDFMGVILLDPAEGLNSIKAAQRLTQAKTNPLLDNPATWQLHPWLMSPVPSPSDKLPPHNLISKASRRSKGPLPPAKCLRSGKIIHQFLDTSTQDGDNNESEHESDQDSKVHRSPRATEIAPSGHMTFNKCLEHIFHHYNHEGIHRAEVSMDMDIGPIESRVYMIELPTICAAGFVLEHLRHRGLSCQTFPQWIFIEARNPLEPCDIPIHSWVHILSGAFKNDIAYVLSIENSSVETLVVPRLLPYYSNTYNSVGGHSLFDVELAREHGLEPHLLPQESGEGDPSLVDRTLTHFSNRWWQDGDTSRICSGEFASKLAHIVAMDLQCKSVTVHVLTDSSSDDVGALEISIHDFKLEFPTGASIKVIAGLDCGFQGMGNDQQLEVLGIFLALYISPTTYASQAHDQVWDDPLANENHLQPGDLVHIISGPHKDLCSMLQYYSSHELLVTSSMIQQKSTADQGDKGKSKAKEPNVTRGDGNIDQDSDLLQISVCMDDAVIIPPATLQFSKEMGYDVTVSDCIEGPVHTIDLIARCLTVLSEDGPWHNFPISFCVKLQDYSLCDIEHQVSCEVWIISGPKKGYRGMLWSLSPNLTALSPRCTTPPPPIADPSVKPGPSTSAYDPWVVHPDDVTSRCSNKTEQQHVDYVTQGCGLPPPGHVLVTVTSSTVSMNVKHHFIPACDLTPANLTSVGQSCLILWGKFAGQIHRVKKCQSKKAPKGVELEDGTKLPLGMTTGLHVDPVQLLIYCFPVPYYNADWGSD